MLEWLIVGGGLQGVIAANFLLGKNPALKEKIRILDPHDGLLSNWNRNTKAVGMEYMRSSLVHHLAYDPFSLQQFAKANKSASWVRFIPPYQRPSIELFRRHTQSVIEANDLEKMFLKGSLRSIKKIENGYRAITTQGDVTARKILLAWGVTESCQMPDWCQELRSEGFEVKHVFGDGNEKLNHESKRIAILGGGISALQLALKYRRLADRNSSVHVISRHQLRVSQFDSDNCWMGPRCLNDFNKIACPIKRREVIKSARRHGSVPKDVSLAFKYEMMKNANQLFFIRADVVGARKGDSNEDSAQLELNDGNSVQIKEFDSIICATGFDTSCPNVELVETISQEFGLPLSNCRFPLLEKNLSWGRENIFAIGSLAELRVGPTARNIIGARQAASILR